VHELCLVGGLEECSERRVAARPGLKVQGAFVRNELWHLEYGHNAPALHPVKAKPNCLGDRLLMATGHRLWSTKHHVRGACERPLDLEDKPRNVACWHLTEFRVISAESYT